MCMLLQTWDLIDPENRIKRSFKEAEQVTSLTTGNAFTRHTLRYSSQHKVQAMLYFPDEDGDGFDGVVAWAAHRNLKIINISSQVTTSISGAADWMHCMAYDKSGEVQVWFAAVVNCACQYVRALLHVDSMQCVSPQLITFCCNTTLHCF